MGSKREIVLYPDRSLAESSAPVTEITDEIRTLVDDMFVTMYEAPGVGLAAPQVGVHLQIVVYDPSPKDEVKDPRVLINPEVTLTGETIVSKGEGCLSVPLEYRADVPRSETIHLKAMGLDGKIFERDIDGFEAIIVQHETDHLKGVLFIDKIGHLRRALYDTKVKKWLKKKQQQ
ncbi:MAG: peptide deformylase [Desulfovibrionaceae bacterium]|nr:peptide deformylase [Desulfovibrionaceae bacterium]